VPGKQIAIIGGGPIGLECLLRAIDEGYNAMLYERGRVGEHVRRWGHVRMFSPHEMNVSERGVEALGDLGASPDALLSGREFVESYLQPLASESRLAPRIQEGVEVLAIGRDGMLKSDAIGHGRRTVPPFRLLLRSNGEEWTTTAHVVIDATGTFGTPNRLGRGGLPAPGEREHETAIDYRLPDLTGEDRDRFADRTTILVGAGHSAATAIVRLADLARENPETRVIWLTRTKRRRPVVEVDDDPLPERARVASAANDLTETDGAWLTRLPGASVASVSLRDDRFVAEVRTKHGDLEMGADRLLALVGYRPDLGLVRELQTRICWATEGTYPLAAALLAADGGGADCLTAGEGLGPETLEHPEPGFYTLGMKSYGRTPSFLIQAGHIQIDHLFGSLLAG